MKLNKVQKLNRTKAVILGQKKVYSKYSQDYKPFFGNLIAYHLTFQVPHYILNMAWEYKLGKI